MLRPHWLSAALVGLGGIEALEDHNPTAALRSYRSIVMATFALDVRRMVDSGQFAREVEAPQPVFEARCLAVRRQLRRC